MSFSDVERLVFCAVVGGLIGAPIGIVIAKIYIHFGRF